MRKREPLASDFARPCATSRLSHGEKKEERFEAVDECLGE